MVASTELAFATGEAQTALGGALIGFSWTSSALLTIGVSIEAGVESGNMSKQEARRYAREIEELPSAKHLELAAEIEDSSSKVIELLHKHGIYGR